MVTDVVVTAREAQHLKCPFTGRDLVVHMIIQPGSVAFCAPDAFTLAEPVSNMAELIQRSTMRNGVSGVVDQKHSRVDPYTGEELRFRELPDGRVCFVGGFNPRAACDSLGQFIYRATMRDGKTSLDNPEKVKAEHTIVQRTLKHKDLKVSDETMKAAESAVEKTGNFRRSVRGASLKKGGR